MHEIMLKYCLFDRIRGLFLGGLLMKKIALVMDGWKRFFTYAWPAGILERIKETQEDVNLYIFNSSGDWSMDEGYNIGEYNIYNLPDFNDFDGIIMDLNNIRHEDIGIKVIDAVKKSGKPAISIANKIDDFYYVGIDNYAAMQGMIQHLYEKHNCKRFWFVMGPVDNYENNVRADSLKEFMKHNGLKYSEDDFYFESYEYQCGYNGFQYLLETHDELPDAVICANDNIAVGVCEAALKAGYNIPTDFCVTGFDNFDKASFYTPQITTVGHIREEVGYCCADIMLKIWSGQIVPQFNYTNVTWIYSESCGCDYCERINMRNHIKEQIMYDIETSAFEEQVLSFEYGLLNCKSVKEMVNLIPQCVPMFKCDAMYLIMDDHMNDFKKRTDYYSHQLIEDVKFHINGYPEQMNVEFAYENGRILSCEGSKISSLFPIFEYDKKGTDFLFMPLHFRNRTVGYFVIRNASYLMEKQYLFKVLNALSSAMENLHEKEKLEYMNQILADISIKDVMTGMYNRLGYQKLAYPLFERKKQEKEGLFILFVDMDKLKYINDKFGHEYGDMAIKVIARAILKYCSEYAIPIRMGGDEFLIIEKMMSDEEIRREIEDMRQEVHNESLSKKFPFDMSFSIGCIKTDVNEDKELDDYVKEADETMYQEKYIKKANRTE